MSILDDSVMEVVSRLQGSLKTNKISPSKACDDDDDYDDDECRGDSCANDCDYSCHDDDECHVQ